MREAAGAPGPEAARGRETRGAEARLCPHPVFCPLPSFPSTLQLEGGDLFKFYFTNLLSPEGRALRGGGEGGGARGRGRARQPVPLARQVR